MVFKSHVMIAVTLQPNAHWSTVTQFSSSKRSYLYLYGNYGTLKGDFVYIGDDVVVGEPLIIIMLLLETG